MDCWTKQKEYEKLIKCMEQSNEVKKLKEQLEKQKATTQYYKRLAEISMRSDEAEFGKLVQQRLDDDEEPIRVNFDEEKDGM